MLYLLNKDVRTVRWNGEPLHEATSAIVKEIMNGDFTLTVKYPISDSGIYQLIQEDMLIKAPTPVLGAQLFRIKKPVEYNDHLEITAYHISDDVMQRSITPVSVTSQSCGMALSRMVQNTKTALGDFSFNSNIQDRRTFNTTETETLYSILLDGKHSIVGTWEGELVRDNFAITVKKSRGENRGVVITTHKNLKNYQRTKNSQNVVTRIHAKSTFKPEGAEKETTIRVTVDSPLINSYPYINEKEYENNNAKTVEELQKWAQSKFSNEGIDKVSDAIKIEAYELDGQVVHMGDTVNLKSWKHNVDAFKKAIAYEFDALKEEYISLTFDDKAGLLRQEISDDIELAKAKAEEVKRELSDTINQRFNSFDNGPLKETKRKAEEALRNAGASSLLAQEAKRIGLDSVARLEAFKSQTTSAQTALSGDLDVLKRTIANDIRPKQAQAETEIAKQVEALSRTKNELAGVKSAQATYEETTTRRLSELTNLANGKASKSELTQTAEELASRIASVQASGRNLFLNSLFKQDISKTGIWTTSTYTAAIDSESKYLGHKALKIIGLNPSGRDGGNPKVTYPALGQFGKVIPGSTTNQDVTISFYAKANKNGIMLRSRLGNIGYKTGNVTLSTEIKRYVVHIPKGWTNESKQTTNEWLFNFNQEGTVWIWMPKFEISDVDTSYSEAPEDIEGQISTVESIFKQRADSLDAGVRSLTEGLRTKADISSLNVTAENIRQSVKSLETDTQNKLNQKLSQAEFEVRAGSIRQEILNATKDKASKSELTQTAEELSSKIASVQVGGINLLRNTASLLIGDRSKGCWMSASGGNGRAISVEVLDPPKKMIKNMIRVIENTNGGNKDLTQLVRLRIGEKYTISCYARIASDSPNANVNLLFRSWANNTDLNRKFQKSISHKNWQKYSFTFTADAIENSIQFGQSGAGIIEICAPKIESGTLATDYSEAPEDIEGQISTVESTFKQRANSLDAGVSRLTEGLRTKVDISALNVTAENIRQSVKSLETDTQNKLNQKLSQAEFEVRAGSIRQEILNATKDKASKSELTQTAEELASRIASVQVGGRNYIRGTKRMMLARGLWASGTFRPSGAGTAKTIDVSDSPVTGFDKAIRLTSSNARDQIGIAQDGFYISQGTYTMSCWVKGRRGQKVKLQTYWQVNDNSGISPIFTLKDENWTKLSFTSARNRAGVASIGYVYLVNAEVGEYLDVLAPQLEDGSLATSSKEAPEDIEGQISTVESTFKQRADSLAAGVNRLTEGLRTKADISALNVTAENIRQSVKSLETDTQNKLNQKLSQAEFEVRAGSIRQEILNATKDKASKSELTQTAEELSSKIASVHLGRRNLLKGTKELARYKPVSEYNGFKVIRTVAGATRYQDSYVERTVIPTAGTEYIAIFYARASENDYPVRCHFYNPNTVVSSENSSGYKSRSSDGLSIIRLSTDWQLCWVKWTQTATDQAKTVIIGRHGPQVGGKEGVWVEICAPAIFEGNLAGDWSPAYEDQDERVSAVESNFKQRADSLEAGVSRLTEGLRTKADISSLNVTAENIRQSVKSLETDTQNKLNQKLSQAEFEVRA
ncbi:phage tail spike protein, partial [Streptococcus pneumoniae]|uniref:phage tail spike protein n=1 Tax=Streptococcus pneumoniae TaxID=1313 RepID=UPI0029C0DA4F